MIELVASVESKTRMKREFVDALAPTNGQLDEFELNYFQSLHMQHTHNDIILEHNWMCSFILKLTLTYLGNYYDK